MESKEYLIKMLSFAKYLYQKAVSELAIGTDLSASVSINQLQDSIEMVLYALEIKLGLNDKENSFPSRITRINKKLKPDTLPFEVQILGINDSRRNFKHKAILQNLEAIREQSLFAYQFINEISKKYFLLNFDEISITSLIKNEKIKQHLQEAEAHLGKEDFSNSIMSSGIAFGFCEKLMKKQLSRIHFFKHSSDWGWSNNELEEKLDSDLSNKIQESFEELYSFNSLAIFGVDYQKYISFVLLTPNVGISSGGKVFTNTGGQFENEHNKTREKAHFCYEFVLDVAFKIQENMLNNLKANYELRMEE
ncbi:MAG: hypothetical protein H8E98_03930 [Bacteroidetes bacterium]|nr:hypothetical protein [Bacteroidota bacterium]